MTMAEPREPTGGSTNNRAAFDYHSSRALLRRVLIQGKPAWSSWLLEDRHEEAQTVVDFLSKVLDDRVDLEGHEEKQILSAIRLIVESPLVYPRGFRLKVVQCDLSQPLNEGRFGYIYRGRLGNRAVCVKAVRLFTQQDNTRDFLAQAKEFALCAHLSHPNILPCYGIYLPEPGKLKICIVSKWMQRGDLRAYLSAYPDSPRRLFLVDVAAGLEYLHKHGIIHANLKAVRRSLTLSLF
ncbi:Serine/threonine-protein kinase HT1 [Leucoagaricus sp. SymC.cos]|nr:Serine/threonine-protein kinase HT1 [Leucoagaricus sp. SymC.cos]